ncbi:MAG: thioredoxin family protein [bacterium]|nr:thioredoxin family protein [bacterium]
MLATGCGGQESTVPERADGQSAMEAPAPREGIPRLVDLGRSFCIPCKMMAPILDELKREYAGRFDVEFIDVGDRPEEARRYRIRIIPTQIFIDASGNELYRHEGFMSKGDILGKWRDLGLNLAPPEG